MHKSTNEYLDAGRGRDSATNDICDYLWEGWVMFFVGFQFFNALFQNFARISPENHYREGFGPSIPAIIISGGTKCATSANMPLLRLQTPTACPEHPTLTGVCEKSFLLSEPLPCNPEAETAIQPLIWHCEGLSSQLSCFPKECSFHGHL